MLRMNAFCGAVGLLVPPLRHEQVMKELHNTHPGITLMKVPARGLVWWPNTDADLERMVQSCLVSFAPQTTSASLGIPKSPWSRLNITMLAPFMVECNIIIFGECIF